MKARAFWLALTLAQGLVSGAHAGVVRWMEIRSTINPATSSYLKENIRTAEGEGAAALIVELDTPGGLLSSVREMVQSVSSSRVPVVVYVTPAGASATSAGALLMFSSHLAVMAPGTNIGAAHPVGSQGEDVKGAMGDKVLNDTVAFAKGLAETHGRNRELAEKVVSKSSSFTADEALKQGLIEVLVSDAAELLQKIEGREVKIGGEARKLSVVGAEVRRSEMRFSQKLLNLLSNPNLSAILMSLGMLLIYFEFQAPGGFLAGILGAICIIISFMSLQTLPIQVGGLALLVLGMVLMLAEPFVTTKGALAAGGVLSFVLGLLWVVDPAYTDLSVSGYVLAPIAIGLGGGIAVIAWAAAHTLKLTREARARMGGGALDGLEGYSALVESVESDGKRGTVRIRGEIWEFESQEVFRAGDQAKVDRVSGLKVHVVRRN